MKINRLVAIAAAFLCLIPMSAGAQNVTKPAENGPAYIGSEREVRKFDGHIAASMDYTAFGICVGTYDDNPELIETELFINVYSSGTWKEINPNSKFILKVNGENIILTTKYGSDWKGGHDSFVSSAGIMGAIGGVTQIVYKSQARYPITGEQLEALMKYGFTKFRFQIVGEVVEDEISERKCRKIAEDLAEDYEEVRKEQAEIHQKVNDLSDF